LKQEKNLMGKRFYRIAALVLIGVFCCGVPALAQDALTQDENTLLDFVVSAFENMGQLDSMAAEIQQTTQRSVSSLDLMNVQTLEQMMIGKIVFDDSDSQIAMTIKHTQSLERSGGDSTTSETSSFSQTVDIIAIGSRRYTRVRDVVSEMATPVSEEWFEIASNENVLVASSSIQQFLSLMTDGFQYPLTTGMVASIAELDTDEIDGHTMRVFDVDFDWERLRLTNPDEFTLLNYLSWDLTSESKRELGVRVWVGVDDEFVHQVMVSAKTKIEIERDAADANDNFFVTITDTIYFHYSHFNEPFDIEAPPASNRF
jgi:hypothetical protein